MSRLLLYADPEGFVSGEWGGGGGLGLRVCRLAISLINDSLIFYLKSKKRVRTNILLRFSGGWGGGGSMNP